MRNFRPGLEVIKRFSFSVQLGMEFMLHINVKKTTIVDILTFISRINDVYCGSLLHAFSARVLMPFHLMCVHIMFSLVWVVEWPSFGEELLIRLTIYSLCVLTIL